MNFLLPLLKYVPFIGLFPKALEIISSIFTNVMPFIGQALEGITWFLKTMWAGLTDVTDDIRTVLFVVTLVLATNVWTIHKENLECRTEITEIKKKLVPKNPVRTVNEFKWPWEGLF